MTKKDMKIEIEKSKRALKEIRPTKSTEDFNRYCENLINLRLLKTALSC